jgi:hypothetical protein
MKQVKVQCKIYKHSSHVWTHSEAMEEAIERIKVIQDENECFFVQHVTSHIGRLTQSHNLSKLWSRGQKKHIGDKREDDGGKGNAFDEENEWG